MAGLAVVLAGAVVFAVTRGPAACAASGAETAAGLTGSGTFAADTAFYVDPTSLVNQWDRTHASDPREPAIARRIGAVPQADWFTRYDPDTIASSVRRITTAAAAQDAVPVLVLYDIPYLNCAMNPPGGAPSIADYESWVGDFAAGLGGHRVIVIVEPDGLSLESCLSAQQAAQRAEAIGRAGAEIHAADPAAKVYFDAGNSVWNPPSVEAARLAAADVTADADGISSNVSQFQSTAAELAYDERVLADLGNPPKLHVVIDTSRNGNGPGNTWCDPAGRALGRTPTADTGNPLVDAYLWVKPPGQADGCAAPAGTFSPALAYALIANGPGGVQRSASRSPSTAPTTVSRSATAVRSRSVSAAPKTSCSH